MANWYHNDVVNTLDELVQNLTNAFKMNDKLQIAKAEVKLGNFPNLENLDNLKSTSRTSLVATENEIALTSIVQNQIEKLLADVFRKALRRHIKENKIFSFCTRRDAVEVDRFSGPITARFGFEISRHDHYDGDLILSGNIIGELEKVFDSMAVNIQFRAIFEDDTGEGNAYYCDTDGFRAIYISSLNLSSTQLSIILAKLVKFKSNLLQ